MAVAGVVERVTTALASPRVLATLLGIGGVGLLTGWLVRRRGGGLPLAAGAAAVPVLVATAVLVAPYFRVRTVHQSLPDRPATPLATADSSPATADSPPTTPAEPVRLTTAALRGLGGHRASGRLAVYRLADGSRIARFEDVDIEGTPTPVVYLVAGRDRERPGGTRAGRLHAERGTFHYELPAGLSGEFTVLVWCERFAVPIAGATVRA